MKLASIILLFGIFAVSPIAVYADASEMTKKIPCIGDTR